MAANGWEWKPRGVGDWLDGIFQVYRGSFKTLFLLAASFLVPLGLIEGLLNPTGSNLFTRIASELRSGSSASSVSSGGYSSLGIVSSIASAFLLVAGVYMVDRYLHGESVSVKSAFTKAVEPGKQPWSRWFGATILESLMLILGGSLAVGLVALVGYLIGLKWLWIIALIAAIPAVIYFGVRWGLAAQAIVIEGLGAKASLGRSFRLTKGSFWSLFGRFIIFYLILFVLAMALSVVSGFVEGLAALAHSAVLAVAVQGITALVNAAIEPLGWIATTLLYYDLRVRKEGYDLQQKVESLEGVAVQ